MAVQRIPLTANFFLDEWVCPEIYHLRGAASVELLDMRIVNGIQWLRDVTGCKIFLNNWWHGGVIDEAGLRSFSTTTGRKFSQHKYGRGADPRVDTMTPTQVLAVVKHHETMLIEAGWITTYERLADTPAHNHFDNRYTGLDRLLSVNG